jgi:NTP pyrophosphatase (non-canonical NTP hydrolase)
MYSFKENDTIADFQRFVQDVYSLNNDRLYSTYDLMIQVQRFMMRALKGIRKNNSVMLKTNLLVALSWFMSLCNREHVDIEEELWKRFPDVCSYCAHKPCACKKLKPTFRIKTKPDQNLRPKTMREFQRMHEEIYPSSERTIFEAGVHAAEEVGEIAEAVHNHLNQHKDKLFEEVRLELADFISCLFDVANSTGMDIAHEFATMAGNNCYVCHQAPCACSYEEVMGFKV